MIRKPLLFVVFALISQTALADGIKLPGVTIDENGIKAPGVVIDGDGISAPGVKIDGNGVRAPGVVIDGDGIRAPGVHVDIGHGKRRDHADFIYSGEPLGADGRIYRDSFDGMDLRGYDFSGYTIERVDFSNTDLEGASFAGARLERVTFSNTHLGGASFAGAWLERVMLFNADLEGTDFTEARLTRVKFDLSILAGACFVQTSMERTDFTGTDLTDALWIDVHANRTNFEDSSRLGLLTHGPASCFEYHSGYAPASTAEIATTRPEVTAAAVIESTLAQGTDARVDLTVNFAYDSDRVEGAARAQIMEIANALNKPSLAEQRIRVEGHTDGDGDAGYNLDLSYRRAISVVRMLVDDYNIPSDRLDVKGFGEDRPIATNDGSQGRALNRRVTLVNLGRV